MARRAADATPRLREEETMARLRHFAVCVKDLEKAAKFYETVFELKRAGREDLEIGSAIYLTDGVINLALLNFSADAGSKASDMADPRGFVGAHHFGFQVDDLAEAQQRIERAGGKFFFDLGDERHGNFERKFKDPDGVIFDISQRGWIGTDGAKK
jgi:predicted enzyme related to lactoylglutathione lyase